DCADAVYSVSVASRTTLRLQVTGQGFEPAAVVTRADPAGSSGSYPPFALGENHTCALSGGGVYCWGADDLGQLGNGGGAGDPDSLTAVAVASLSSIVQVAAGQNHACAVTAQGAVYCWGAGGAGQLGDGGNADRYAPSQVLGIGGSGTLGNAVQVACGAAHCCALEGDGSVACWGSDAHGELGDGQSGTSSATPVAVTTGERFDQLVAAGDHSCAVRRSDKAVYCWGGGGHGKLGNGGTADNLVPGPVSGLSNVRSVMAGQDHDCAVLAQGELMCWGDGFDGKLGQGSDHAEHDTPVAVLSASSGVALDSVASSWAAGRRHTCAVLLSGLARCFGDDGLQQLGDAGRSVGGSDFAVEVDGLIDATQIVSAYDHTCALRANGALVCWGDGAHGKLGNGSTSSSASPAPAQSGAPQVSFGTGVLDAAFTHACASIAQSPDPGCTRAELGSRSYFFCENNPRTWAGAGLACNAAGYQLVDLDTAGETAFASAQLAAASWIGAKRESSADWLTLASGYDFDDLLGNKIWETTRVSYESCSFGFSCHTVRTRGFFTSYGEPDWVGDQPYSSSSTWGALDEPSPQPGRNCAMLLPSGKLATDVCALSSTPVVVAGGYAAPPFAGGVRHDFICEERNRFTDVTLDEGRYFITVKGAGSPQGGACVGAYALQLDDLGTSDGGYLGCDDNGVAGSTASAIEATLPAGDYYLVLKGKRAGDAGAYALTVRDVDAVHTNEIACNAGQGRANPAVVSFTAEPGKSYYALVKGESPLDKGPYTLNARSHKGTGDRLACDSGSAPDGASTLALDLPTGSYYAVVTGHAGSTQGTFELSVGGASPVSATFVPPSYADTVAALTASHIRVATVLSCDASLASCTDAQAQAALLATDTSGVVRSASSAQDVPAEVASAVRELERFDSVSAQLEFAPDANPGFVKSQLAAVMDPGNSCMPGDDAASFRACSPGSSPSFSVSLANPALQPVPPGSGPLGGYRFTLHVQGTRDGVTRYTEDVPVLVVPSGGTPPMTYDQGSYHQDFDSRGCGVGTNTRPSWDDLSFAADVRPDTRLDFYACSADVLGDLAKCDTGLPSSGYKRVLTVTAGQGSGKACTVATQDVDCPAGYCSPYTSLCNTLEGASCGQDSECPGTSPGRCRDGPTAATLGATCVPPNSVASIATALGDDNYHPVLRLRVDLQSLGDGSRTPGLFFFEAKYRCRNVE
ncbi:MAG: RCC1 domain-containing protein, partial [Polyangiales bacterium]